jgi:antitoxin CcdA
MRMYNAYVARASGSRRKVPTNLTVRADLVARAKQLGLNLSQLVEGAIADAIREADRTAWLEENRDAIDDYNARIAKRGLFSDDWRRF